MKKLLLCGVAALAVAAAAPAKAEGIDLGLGGYFIGYGVYTGQDDGAADLKSFGLRKETELHFTGETTLDNGLTVGGHIETNVDRSQDSTVEESYAYFSGGWGRVNFGEEDGAAYLLQVAAPSADENIDGLRPDINALDLSLMNAGSASSVLNYAHDDTGYQNKITYITPLFSGFQAGFSMTPNVEESDVLGNTPLAADDGLGDWDTGYEAAVRYQGVFGATDVTVGAGYSRITTEADAAGTTTPGTDDLNTMNVGARLGFGAFGLGASYVDSNNGVDTDGDTTTWVAGADYTTGPFKVGLSYLDRSEEANAPNAVGGTGDVDTTRWTAGVGYQYGPGMSLNGSVARVSVEDDASDGDGYQVAVGTRVDF